MQADVDMYFYSHEVIPAVYDKSTKRWKCDKGETVATTRRTGLGGRRRLDPNMASRCFATGCNRALYGIVLSHAPKSLARVERGSQQRTNSWS